MLSSGDPDRDMGRPWHGLDRAGQVNIEIMAARGWRRVALN